MLKLIGVAFLSLALFAGALVAGSSCVVVDVKTADGLRIIVPVPLAAARAAMAFAPDEARRVTVPELAEYTELATRIVEELRASGDGVLVEVDSGSEHVVVEKVGDELVIDAATGEEDVSVRLPLEAVTGVLASYDGRDIDVGRALGALSALSNGDLIHVETADEEVEVWIW